MLNLILLFIIVLLILFSIDNPNNEHYNNSNFKITEPKYVSELYQMLYIVDHILTKNNIEYFMSGGTLLGAVRHRGIIPWDDDGDLDMWKKDVKKFLSLRKEFAKHGLVVMETWWGYKIFHKNGKPIPKYKWKYPAIDIFVIELDKNKKIKYSYERAQRIFGTCLPDYNSMYPLERYEFGQLNLLGISRYGIEKYFTQCYGDDWADYAYQTYDHSQEKQIKKVKVKLTDQDKQPAQPIDLSDFLNNLDM